MMRSSPLRRNLWALGVVVIGRISADAVGVEAGSLTYGAFLSLPPLLIVLMTIVGRVLHEDPAATERMLHAVGQAIPGIDQVLSTSITLRTAQQLGLGLAGLALVIWAASGFAARARHAFGHIFRTERTGLIFGRLSAAVVGTPIVLLFVALTAAGGVAANLRIAGSIPWVTEIVTYAGIAVMVWVFAMLSYRLLTPGAGPTLRGHLPGAILFTLGWLVLHFVGAEYVARVVTRATALYGAIGAIFGVLAFLYATMWWLLFCAEVTQASREERDAPPGSAADA
jgi:membrane protein